MATTSKTTLKNWFKKGLKPLEVQFAAWMDSYWHKDESIPITSIADLEDTLNDFAPISATDSLATLKEDKANKGQPNGYASLDGSGLVPAGQLPSYVDDVLEFADLASFPGSGESGKIYIAVDTNLSYRWSGSVYVQVTSVPSDASDTVKGIAKLYPDLAASNMDGAPSQAAVKTVIDAKAPLASPAFTGTPTAPTPASGDKTTKIATTAFVGPHVPSTAVAGNDGTYDTLTCDLSTDNYWRAVITGDVKIVPTNPVDGEFFAVNLIVDAVGTQQVRVPVNSYVMSNTQDIQGGGDTYPIVIQGKASGGDPPLLTTLYFQIIEYPAATINYRIKLSERS